MAEIKTTYKGDMLFETKVGNHVISADVPAVMGGHDRAVTPPDLFLASLSSCIGAFAAAYCCEHDICTDDLAVTLEFEKASDPTRLVNLKARLELPHADCGKRAAAIKRAAMHCPVHESIKVFDGFELELVTPKNGDQE